MSGAPDNHELARQIAVMEGSVEALQAKFEANESKLSSTLNQINANMAASTANLKVWIITTALGVVGFTVALLRFWPPAG